MTLKHESDQHFTLLVQANPSAMRNSTEKKTEREFSLSIQPALADEDMSMLESSAKVRMAAKQ